MALSTDLYGHLILGTLRGEAVRCRGDWTARRLLWRVYEHGLAGLLAEAIVRLGPQADPVLIALLPDLHANAAAQEAVVRPKLQAAAEISAALDRAVVWVKGAALSSTVYERPGLRTFGDLDLLTAPASVPAVVGVLERLGFVREGPADSMAASYERSDPVGVVAVDLHWDFVEKDGPQGAVEIPIDDILARSRPAGALQVPSTEDSLLLGAANLVRSRVDRIVLLVDFARLAAAGPDWGAVRERAVAWRLRTSLWLGLALAKEHLGAAVPDEALEGLSPARWKSDLLRGMLAGSTLWARRKIRARAVAYGLPFLCADSTGDIARAMLGSRGRIWKRL
jgi:hypothetical protein